MMREETRMREETLIRNEWWSLAAVVSASLVSIGCFDFFSGRL
jgi:hypothetical protein